MVSTQIFVIYSMTCFLVWKFYHPKTQDLSWLFACSSELNLPGSDVSYAQTQHNRDQTKTQRCDFVGRCGRMDIWHGTITPRGINPWASCDSGVIGIFQAQGMFTKNSCYTTCPPAVSITCPPLFLWYSHSRKLRRVKNSCIKRIFRE